MNDILGRELKDGDMAIGMAIGRNSSGMHIGVIQGNSVCRAVKEYRTSEYRLEKSATSNTYLIANPTPEELVIKERILQLLENEKLKREEKKKIRTIPLGKLQVGGIYEDVSGHKYIYLGRNRVVFTARYYTTDKIGHCFVNSCYYDNDKNEFTGLINTYRERYNLDVLVGAKKLTKLIGTVDVKLPITLTEIGRYYGEYELSIDKIN